MKLLADVAQALDGEVATVNFDPSGATSVERAIADVN
jgi:hypothetical protein